MYRRSVFIALIVASVLVATCVTAAQTQPPSDPQALAYASQSIAAMTGGTTINDVTLTGTASWNGTDTGTATLNAFSTNESRIDLQLTSGTRTEIRDAQTGAAIGKWVNPDTTSGVFAFQNCQTDAVWFFPALGSLAVGPNVVLSYIGQETRNGEAVQHLQSYIYQSTPPPGVPTQQLSTMDFYLDAATFLPSSITFNTHPDDGSAANLGIEIDFSNYQNQGGIQVPMHVQRFSQGNLQMDVTLTSAQFNTGLSLSVFAVN